MNNPMAAANVAIISELKKFMTESVLNFSQKSKYVREKTKDFTRTRILTFSVLSLMILNALKRSLSIEIQDFFTYAICKGSCTKQAFSKQRGKLKADFFHCCNEVLLSGFYQHYGKHVKRKKGNLLFAVDGSTIALPQTEALMQVFGGATNQFAKEPVSVTARICVFYDVLNRLVIKGKLHSYFSSEDDACMESMDNMDFQDKIFIFDRGYPSFWLMFLLIQKGVKFVMRVRQRENNTVKQFMASAQTDLVSQWYPGYNSRKKLKEKNIDVNRETSITVRMVKIILDTGETEVLVTNLLDSQTYTIQDLKEIYALRWGIETGYGYLKEELQLAQFSGIRQICIEQDFAANLLLFNLQSLIEKQSEVYLKTVNDKRKYNYKVNKNISWGMLKYRVVRLFLEADSLTVLMELENLFNKHLEPIRPERKYPRKKRRPPNGKVYTLTNYKRAL